MAAKKGKEIRERHASGLLHKSMYSDSQSRYGNLPKSADNRKNEYLLATK